MESLHFHRRWMMLGLAAFVLASVPAAARAASLSFSDDFTPVASPLWSDSSGNWTASNGDYYAQVPNNNPMADTSLPFDFTNNLQLTVTVNALGDAGISFDSGDVLLVLGGEGYGQGSRGGAAGNSAYWATPGNSVQDLVTGVFTPGNTYTITVTINGDTYTAYNDPNGAFDASSTVLTTLTSSAFTHGQVDLYDDQPNTTTGSGFGPPTSFSNFNVSGTLTTTTPEPSSCILLGVALVLLAVAQRRIPILRL